MRRVAGVATCAALLFVFTTYICAAELPSQKRYEVLAHRGLHQTFDPVGVTNTTCTASRIDRPRHDYIENTLTSIQAAIDLGADIIEFDVHPTTDGEFVVFHDWSLECRTDGRGVVREQGSRYLKSLDVGYGYTADNGKSYPFRGKFKGAMPTLGEVLARFPDTRFMINIKSDSIEEAQQLTAYLKARKALNRRRLSLYAAEHAASEFARLNSDIMIMSKERARSCLTSYILLGWSGHIPESCYRSYVPVPMNYRWLVWGWPEKFEARMRSVGSRSLLMGAHEKGKANSGIDSIEMLKEVSEGFGGIIFTNRIDLFAEVTGRKAAH